MATSKKPAIVLLHGIWHSPLTYDKLVSSLRNAGYDVHVPFFPSCSGARPPATGLPEDTQLARRLIEMLADQGRSIILLTHSYGGVVGCNAIEGLDIKSRASRGQAGGVAQFIGLAAHIHPKDFSVLDLVREMGNEDLIPLAFEIADDGSSMPAAGRASLFNGVPDKEAERLMLTLSRANFNGCLDSKVLFEGWKHVPLTYLHTLQDMTVPPHYQQRILEKIEKAGTKVDVVELDTGHSPFVTMTAEVVQVIENVAAKIA